MPRLGTKQGGCLACGLKEGGPSGEVRLFAIAENAIADQSNFLGCILEPAQYGQQEWVKMLQSVRARTAPRRVLGFCSPPHPLCNHRFARPARSPCTHPTAAFASVLCCTSR